MCHQKTKGKCLVELETETDLQLRTDLIDMESQQLENEIATTISRGDAIVLMIHSAQGHLARAQAFRREEEGGLREG